MDDLRPTTSFGPNDIDNINEAVEVNFGLLSKKAKRWQYNPLCFSIKVSRV